MSISVTSLRRKYPHPVSGRGSCYGQYCVAGALSKEVGQGFDFPRWEQLRDAVETATGINHYLMNDAHNELFRELCENVIALNDHGYFDAAWNKLGVLLKWKQPPCKNRVAHWR